MKTMVIAVGFGALITLFVVGYGFAIYTAANFIDAHERDTVYTTTVDTVYVHDVEAR